MSADSTWGLTPEDRNACREMMTKTRIEGMFTPPSFEGSLVYPSAVGGTNWGGASVDDLHHLLITSINRLFQLVRVIPLDRLRAVADSNKRPAD